MYLVARECFLCQMPISEHRTQIVVCTYRITNSYSLEGIFTDDFWLSGFDNSGVWCPDAEDDLQELAR